MSAAFAYALAAAGGYLLGSIPFGLVLTRLAGLGDIREIGSGNIGATNVLRTGRKDLALATLVLDAGKAGLAAALAFALLDAAYAAALAGAAAFLGHLYPVWLGFKGGKGVATFFGTLLVAAWPVGAFAALTWLLTARLFRYSSLAALVAAGSAPLAALGLGALGAPVGALMRAPAQTAGVVAVALLCAAMGGLIYWRHRANIARLISGAEPKIGDKKP